MKRSALFTLAAVVAVAACQEATTSPQTATDITPAEFRFSNPPPPPIDTGAGVSFNQQTFAPQRAITLQAECEGASPGTGIVLPVVYMYNPEGNAGYLHFESSPLDSLTTDAYGMVRMQAGVFTGQGKVEMIIDGCPLVIELSSVQQSSSFGACGTPPVDITEIEPQQRQEFGCFLLFFDEVTLGGEDIGGAQMTAVPRCQPDDANRPECNPFLEEDVIIID